MIYNRIYDGIKYNFEIPSHKLYVMDAPVGQIFLKNMILERVNISAQGACIHFSYRKVNQKYCNNSYWLLPHEWLGCKFLTEDKFRKLKVFL